MLIKNLNILGKISDNPNPFVPRSPISQYYLFQSHPLESRISSRDGLPVDFENAYVKTGQKVFVSFFTCIHV